MRMRIAPPELAGATHAIIITGFSLYLTASLYCCSAEVQNRVPVRLVGSDAPSYGRVEVMLNNTFGTLLVPSNAFTSKEADLLCKQLGYPGGIVAPQNTFAPTAGDKVFWRANISCTAATSSIIDCLRSPQMSSTATDAQVGVYCGKPAGRHSWLVGLQPVRESS